MRWNLHKCLTVHRQSLMHLHKTTNTRNRLRISHLEMKLDTAVQRHHLLLEHQSEMLVKIENSLKQPSNRPELKQPQRPTMQPGNASSENDKIGDQSHLLLKQRAVCDSGVLQCLKDCPCRCHFRTVVRSPQLITEWLGDLLLGCASLPWYLSGLIACNEQTCRRSRQPASDIQYFLPRWTSQVVGSFSITFNIRRPPIHVCVHTRCIIPYDSAILICAQEGDVDGARKLLLSGQASINDVDPYGLGVLYVSARGALRYGAAGVNRVPQSLTTVWQQYAAYYGWRASGRDAAVRMCRFLLDVGASRDWDDEIGKYDFPCHSRVNGFVY